MEKIIAFWDCYDSKTGRLLEKGRMIDYPVVEPTVGEPIVGVGPLEQAVIERFRKAIPRDGLPTYIVYVSPRH